MIQTFRTLLAASLLLLSSTAFADDQDIAVGIAPAQPNPSAPEKTVAQSPHLLKLEKVQVAAFSPDGKVLLTVSETDSQVHLWSSETGQEVNRFGDSVTHLLYSANSQRVMTWGTDGVTRIFNAQNGKALCRLEGAGNHLSAAAISPDGSLALTCADDEKVIRIWNTATGKQEGAPLDQGAPITSLTISPDGKQAVSIADKELWGWELADRKAVQKIALPAPAQKPYYSANGKLILVFMNGKPAIYELSSGEPILFPRNKEERFPAGTYTGDRKFTVSRALAMAAIIDADGKTEKKLEGAIDGITTCNAFTNDGSRVVLGTGKVSLFSRNPNEPGKVYVYDVASGKRLAEFSGHAREVTEVGINASGNRTFSRDGDRTLFLWAIK